MTQTKCPTCNAPVERIHQARFCKGCDTAEHNTLTYTPSPTASAVIEAAKKWSEVDAAWRATDDYDAPGEWWFQLKAIIRTVAEHEKAIKGDKNG